MPEPVRVLLVDDDEDEFVVTRDLFEEIGPGYELEWARTYDEGVEEMRRDCRDAYLVDYHLGAHTGVELLKAARAGGCGSPILILTGAGDRAVDLEAMEAGAADYLDKSQLSAALLERSIRYAIERRRADEKLANTGAELRRLSTLFAQAPAMINILMGPDHRYELVHPSLQQMVGRDIRGLPAREAIPELDPVFTDLLDRTYAKGETITRKAARWVMRCADGQLREMFFDFTYRPWRDAGGRIAGVMSFAVEVTEQVRSRNRVQEQVRKLEAVEAKLQDAVRTRDEFLSIASHELNTPLTPLNLQLDQLRRVLIREGAQPEILALLETAKRQTGRLGDLVEKLLDVSRVATRRLALNLENMDLAQLARDIAERFRPQAAAAQSELLVEEEARALGRWDRFRLEQVISNLLSNAIKYGRGKPIRLRVSAAEDTARLSVRDEGIGIAGSDVTRIFGRFERAVSSRHYGGLGLGLYIAHEIVEAHGGCIVVQSEPGHGSTFTVLLPMEVQEQRAPMHH